MEVSYVRECGLSCLGIVQVNQFVRADLQVSMICTDSMNLGVLALFSINTYQIVVCHDQLLIRKNQRPKAEDDYDERISCEVTLGTLQRGVEECERITESQRRLDTVHFIPGDFVDSIFPVNADQQGCDYGVDTLYS
jgi:hypothetical protein